MESEPQFLDTWDINLCESSNQGVPAHKDFDHIRMYCQSHELKTTK
jgi:hypothetical protein